MRFIIYLQINVMIMAIDLKTYFDAKDIPTFAMAKNVKLKNEFRGGSSITSIDEVVVNQDIKALQKMIPTPEVPTQKDKKELFDWRFTDDDEQVDLDLLHFDDSPVSLTGESTDMEIFGENYVIFWIVPADEDKLLEAMKSALHHLLEIEKEHEVVASLFLENYISRIYMVQHDKDVYELQDILEASLERLFDYLKNQFGEESELLNELREMIGL
jgi:hypothetical protein